MQITVKELNEYIRNGIIFRQLFDASASTFTYLLADTDSGEAVLIDPVLEQANQYMKLLDELNLKLGYVLDTHIHADHITAAGALRKKTGCNIGISARADIACADLLLREGVTIHFGPHAIHVLETPGHTRTCLSYVYENMVFTGDTLLIDGCGRTDFQDGDAGLLYDSITQKLFVLPDETRVFPAHDYHDRTSTTLGEQKQNNPRLCLNRDDFIRLMTEMSLPLPQRIRESVPANLACGQPEQAHAAWQKTGNVSNPEEGDAL